MIKILRTPEPGYLSSIKVTSGKQNLEDNYGKEYRQERLRFDHSILQEVKNDLLMMCNGKCAYCESPVGTIDAGDVDNFRPRDGARGLEPNQYAPEHYFWLAYEWSNLLFACLICSQKYKRDYFPLENESDRAPIGTIGEALLAEKPLLIDPTTDDPSEHLKFSFDGLVAPLSTKGSCTIEVLGLNRRELVEQRRIHAEGLLLRLETYTQSTDDERIKELRAAMRSLFSEIPIVSYAAVQRQVFDDWNNENPWFILFSGIRKDWRKTYTADAQGDDAIHTAGSGVEKVVDSEIRRKLDQLKRFSIKAIEIENFKAIRKLKLEMAPRPDELESWLLLLGDNGIGKSSILQAITLTLCTKSQIEKLGLNVLDYLRRGTESGRVSIHSYEHDEPVTLTFDKKGFTSNIEEAVTFVLAYGSTRLLPKRGIQPDTDKEDFLNVRNLFDYSTSLTEPAGWLSGVDQDEFNRRVAPAFFDLLALRGEDRIEMVDGKINIQQFGEGYDLESNSDGYKTITALVADIMQTLSIEKANYHNSHGIVLIDEIGNHLHPRWRMKIVSALRKAFPQLQFIVTTHEPLCLRGLAHGEVVVLVRDHDNVIRALDKELLPDHNLLRIDQLLTSDLFGLINVMDSETEKTYEEYYKLLSKETSKRTDEETAKISEYSSVLAGKEMLGNSPMTQAVFEVLNSEFVTKLKDEGFKTAEQLKKETIDEVKSIIRKGGMDWL